MGQLHFDAYAEAANMRMKTNTKISSHDGRFKSYEGTRTCIECHYSEAMEVHSSVHYQWRGDASKTTALSNPEAGKLGGINDFCIYPDINWIGKVTNVDGVQVDGGCAKCHTGLGLKPDPEPTPEQLENIDCLVCHSKDYKRTVENVDGTYRFVPDTKNMTVDLLEAAWNIKSPDNDTCLNCHTKAGGGDNFKRGDIEEAHRNPTRDFDVHMAPLTEGGAGLKCIDCHNTTAHRFAGRGTDLRPLDSTEKLDCTKCHDSRPHSNSRIDKHTARLNCTVCHIPEFAKVAATDMDRDWSKPGELNEQGFYEPNHIKGRNVIPKYKFFNGLSYFYEFGKPALPSESGRIVMASPEGSVVDPGAKIYAFKHHLATQPIDPLSGRLLPLKIGIFFQTGEIDSAVAIGTKSVGWHYEEHGFAATERYMGLFHEVAPKQEALSCNDCHNGGDRLDFSALGYIPRETYKGVKLCGSCHKDKSYEWKSSERFQKIHEKHVSDKKYDCSACHNFSSAN